jgi:predicted ester cyclase
MGVKENKELVRHIYRLLNQGNWTAYWDDLCSPRLIEHMTDRDMNLEQAKQFEAGFLANITDLNITINHMVAEADKVAVFVTWKWTFKGTGKKGEMTNANIFKLSNGKIIEGWNVTDIRMAQQLGGMPK